MQITRLRTDVLRMSMSEPSFLNAIVAGDEAQRAIRVQGELLPL
jgi:hypothetical protein